MGRNKNVMCEVCLKTFRSDKMKIHQAQHQRESKYKLKNCTICHKTMIAWHLPRHQKIHKQSASQIIENAKADQCIYDDARKTGQIVEDLMENEDIDPKSLRNEYVKALEINSLRMKVDYESLKLWQEKLLGLMEPTLREIIWVTGRKGAEGKSWFQEYTEHHYGCKRVFRTTISKNTESILHCLSKRTLSLTNVFVFNIPRSFDMKYVPYTLFEEIKDGQAISVKYDSKVLKFKTPNILIIFSNNQPRMSEVSLDRWKIYSIREDKLCKLV